ncbi:B3 domain-containing protein At2g24670-like [Lotus japonicus]|uniref:B3 domain-containing protein At2g24670-like n=1 Tax=Lotus japonicus TaxID=34305 RepID=UPI0025889870|nr:B3 domain-containing protein At2g24670-like [Lotus japonicus]
MILSEQAPHFCWKKRLSHKFYCEKLIQEIPPKPAKKKSRKKIASENVQELPIEIRNRIEELNGTNTQFLMSKKLYNTDVKANNNRLSMPENSIKCEFLTEAEKKSTAEQQGVDVTVLDPGLREHSLVLKKWKMNSVFVYNLIKNWNKVVSENHFQKDHELQIWSFRVNTKLYFVLNKV